MNNSWVLFVSNNRTNVTIYSEEESSNLHSSSTFYTMSWVTKVVVLGFLCLSLCQASPKFDNSDKGFVPSKGNFYETNTDQVAMETANADSIAGDRPARFGFPTYSTDVQNPNTVVPGVYGPVKLDIGGLVLGTIVGLGAFFILPKILTVISNPYGGGAFKRSEDGTVQQPQADISELLGKVQGALSSYNIDSAACAQRALCSTVRSANQKVSSRSGSTLDNVIDTVASIDMFKSLMDGTDWKKAIDVGQNGDSCSMAFAKCPFSVETVVSAVSNYVGAA